MSTSGRHSLLDKIPFLWPGGDYIVLGGEVPPRPIRARFFRAQLLRDAQHEATARGPWRMIVSQSRRCQQMSGTASVQEETYSPAAGNGSHNTTRNQHRPKASCALE